MGRVLTKDFASSVPKPKKSVQGEKSGLQQAEWHVQNHWWHGIGQLLVGRLVGMQAKAGESFAHF
jgi:hypothetical protein